MNWDDVRIFLAVARAGQILGAARRLELNHATVSRRIAALERALGTKLFRRLTTGSELTTEGERFLTVAERIEADMIAARAEIVGEGDDVSGVVRIGAPDGFGVSFLASRLGVLTEQYPNLAIQLVPVPRSFSLSRREADIAITVERPTEGRLIAGKLVDYSLSLYASKDYLKRHGMPQSIADLKHHRLIGYVADLLISLSLDYGPEIMPDWQANFAVSSALGQVEAVRSGAGVGILHSYIARVHADLVLVPVAPPIRRANWLVYHATGQPLRRVQVVSSFIAATVEAERAVFA